MSPVVRWVGPVAVVLVALVALVDGTRLYMAGLTGPVAFWVRAAWLVLFVYVWLRREMAVQALFRATAALLAELKRGTRPTTEKGGLTCRSRTSCQ